MSDMEEHSNATIHGVVVEISPTNASRKNPDVKYFSEKITDGKKVARVISFDPKLRSILVKSREEKTSLALVNCNVRKVSSILGWR